MATNTLPPPPINDKPGSFTWLEWYRQLRNYVSTSGSVPWYILNFAGSSITDIASRDHNNLQNLQGGSAGEMYHLSQPLLQQVVANVHNAANGLQGGTSGEYYHLTSDEHASISNSLELLDTTATQSLPTTPTVLKPPTTVISSGITYDSSTGEIVFVNGGSYSFTLMLSAAAAAATKNIYFYAEIDTGSGYAIKQYSARSAELDNTIDIQTLFTSSNYFPKGAKLKIYVWASSATITLNTINVPGTTPGTVTIPAVRLMLSGSL